MLVHLLAETHYALELEFFPAELNQHQVSLASIAPLLLSCKGALKKALNFAAVLIGTARKLIALRPS